MKATKFIALVLLLAVGWPVPSTAIGHCRLRDTYLSFLYKNHDESVIAGGQLPDGRRIELLISDGGSFTMLISSAAGLSCIVFSGQDWEFELMSPKPGKDG